MAGKTIYRGTFDNTQVDYTDNSPNEQTIIVTIEDLNSNLYEFAVTEFAVSGGNTDYLFSWINAGNPNYPSWATATTIGYSTDGGLTWTDNTGTAISPRILTLPTDTYQFRIKFEPEGEWFYIGEENEVELDLADFPVRISVIDNDEDKFTPIRSKQAEIRVHTRSDFDITAFAGGSDGQFLTKVYVNTEDEDGLIFAGFLSIEDLQQDFQPHPNVLVLTATDGLGFLKDLPLLDYNGNEFSGENAIIDYIVGALKRTGLTLDVVAEMNIREADYAPFTETLTFTAPDEIELSDDHVFYLGQVISLTQQFGGTGLNNGNFTITAVTPGTGTQTLTVAEAIANETGSYLVDYLDAHFYIATFLDAKTFEADINEFEDCYTVLEKILTENACLFQQNGRWYIKRVDEIDQQLSIRYVFNANGTFDSVVPELDIKKQIGADNQTYSMCFMNEDAIVAPLRAHKFVKHEFRFEQPEEVPCNSNFVRGDYLEDISATEKKYGTECWTLYQDRPNVISTTAEAFIYRKFDTFSNESERYVIIGVASADIEQQLISQFIPIDAEDKFDLSFQVKYNGQVETAAGTITGNYAQVRLYADDGTFYTLDGGLASTGRETEWVACTADFDTNQQFFSIQFDGTDDDTEWRTIGFSGGDCPPCPKTGKIQIVFCHQLKPDEFELHISDFRFTYIPHINGSYQTYTGQQHISEQTDGKAGRTKQVYISDSPKKLFKGALLKYNGEKYILTEGFYNALVFPGGPPDSTYVKPFGEIQNQDVWNQFNRLFWSFEGTLDGLDTEKQLDGKPDLPDLHHYFELKDPSVTTNNKKFVLLYTEQDLDGCEWTAKFAEVYDSEVVKNYEGHEFKYIESER